MAALLVCSVFAVAADVPPAPGSPPVGPDSTTLSGTLIAKGGMFFLSDEATGLTWEVRGPGLKKDAGHRVRLTGTVKLVAAGSQQVLIVGQSSRLSAIGGKTAAAGLKMGLPKAAVIGIAAGGATAATVGGMYAAGVFSGNDQAASRK